MQQSVANGVEQNRLQTVPPDDGVNLHRTERRVCDAHRLRCIRFGLIAIHRPQPAAARPAAYRCAVFVDLLTRQRSRSFRWGGRPDAQSTLGRTLPTRRAGTPVTSTGTCRAEGRPVQLRGPSASRCGMETTPAYSSPLLPPSPRLAAR